MSTRGAIILGVVFAGTIALYVFIGARDRAVQRDIAEAKRVFAFDAGEVTSLSIEQQGGVLVEALRAEGEPWRIVAPYRHIPANQARWNQLAEVVAGLMNERTIEEDVDDRSIFALDDPALSVIVGTMGGELMQIGFGALDPTQRNRYAQIGDGDVFLTDTDNYARLDRNLLNLRDRRIFDHLDDGLASITYERLPTAHDEDAEPLNDDIAARTTAIDETYTVGGDGTWRVSAPMDALARQDRLDALARLLRVLGGREYIDAPESIADYGLQPPFARLTARNPDGEEETLLFGWIADDAKNAGLFVKRADSPSVLVADAKLLNFLPGSPQDFREKRLFTREAARLKTVRYEDSRHTILVESIPGKGLRMIEPPVENTDQIAISMYVSMLKRIEGDTFPDAGDAAGFSPPRIVLDFTYDDGSSNSRIVIGGPVPGSDPVRFFARQDFGPLTTISFKEFQILQVEPFDFRVKTLFSFRPEWVGEVDLRFENESYRFLHTEGRWSIAQPEGARLEAQSDMTHLLNAFVETHAKGIAEPPPSPEVTGLENPLLEVTFHLKDGISAATGGVIGPARIGNRKTAASRERFLSLDGRSEMYFVDQGIVDEVRAVLADVRRP